MYIKVCWLGVDGKNSLSSATYPIHVQQGLNFASMRVSGLSRSSSGFLEPALRLSLTMMGASIIIKAIFQ